MRITAINTRKEAIKLVRPYTIAFKTTDAVELFFVELVTDTGAIGLGSASPVEEITGETHAACEAALATERLDWLARADPRRLGAHLQVLAKQLSATPAARAAMDMALYDLFAKAVGLPLAEILGRCHDGLPTSITIGIMSVDQTLAEAEEYHGRGFRCLKVKTGHSYAVDVERLRKLRERFGQEMTIRVDANQGYTADETWTFQGVLDELNIEFLEQPMPAERLADMRTLPDSLRQRIAADENLHAEHDALALAAEPSTCGIFNIKLMKCGGVDPALRIARIAETASIELMFGCMDESVISLAAALHAAYACPNTKYLDLDGNLDLARDPAVGGFTLRDGRLFLGDAPGLGVQWDR